MTDELDNASPNIHSGIADTGESGPAAPVASHTMQLKPGMSGQTAGSLLRYVDSFGQGRGMVRSAGPTLLIDLEFKEDAEMLRRQFTDLFTDLLTGPFAGPEAVDGHGS